jgi:hypothetical protein
MTSHSFFKHTIFSSLPSSPLNPARDTNMADLREERLFEKDAARQTADYMDGGMDDAARARAEATEDDLMSMGWTADLAMHPKASLSAAQNINTTLSPRRRTSTAHCRILPRISAFPPHY